MTIQLTQDGFIALQKELEMMKNQKRPLAVERLHKARSMGDLSENSEYSAAKEELAFIEGRIQEIEHIIKTAEVSDKPTNNNIVELGNFVTVEVNGNKDEYQIVGEFEADPLNKKLSSTSPIGSALMGKRVGESIEVQIPAGKISYKIISIK